MAEERGPGRPKGPLNEVELAQRRAAPWKHGRDAATPTAQLYPPCSDRDCPLKYPCDVLRSVQQQGRTLDRCALHVAVAPTKRHTESYLLALSTGDPTAVDGIIAEGLGRMAGLFGSELDLLSSEGLTCLQPMVDREGNVVAELPIENPRSKGVFRLSELLGVSAAQAGLTRKAKAEIHRDNEAASLLDFIATNAKQRKGGGE